MREISEKLRATILAAIPTDNLVLFYAPLYGTSPTITDRVLAANNGTFTNPKWKTLPNGLVVPSFDGTAYIRNTTANWRSADSQGAIGVWFKTSNSTQQALFCSADEGSTNRFVYFYIDATTGVITISQRNADTQDVVKGATAANDGKWHSAFVTSDGSAWALLLDGVAETLTPSGGGNTGDWFADTLLMDNLVIGLLYRSTKVSYMVGQIGLVVVYSVAPTVAQILQMTNRLKGVFH